MDWISERVLQGDPDQESEIQRICHIPISEPLTDAEVEAVNQVQIKAEAYTKGFRFKRVQAEALQTFAEKGSVFAPVSVGGGKTLICLRCLGIAFENGVQRAVMVVPSNVYNQLISHDIDWARRRVPLGFNFYLLGGKSPAKRRELAGGRRGCWVLPYSLLSRPDTFELLEAIRPELIVFDEAHNIKNRGAARTKRILTYWKKHRPRVACASGTMTRKSIKDFSHMLTMSLGAGAPVPADANIVQEWAAVLDSEQAQTETYHKGKASAGPLRPLINWSNRHFSHTRIDFDVPGFRQAFQNRLLTTPGVIATPADELGTSIVIQNLKGSHMTRPGGAELDELIHKLNNAWVSPSGDEIEHAMLIWGLNYQLTAGFYYLQIWPEPEDIAHKRGMSADEAESLLERSIDYHERLNEYHKVLRAWFTHGGHRPGLDTPMLVGGDMARHGSTNVGNELFMSWQQKEAADFEGRVARLSLPVRVCDYKLQMAVDWCKQQEEGLGGILWYHHDDLGLWLFETLMASGIPAVHCPAGREADKFLTPYDEAAKRCKGKFLVCSTRAHGQGKNLQFMQNQLFVQLPVSEDSMEQSIGRTHRSGQEADEVVCTTLVSNEFDDMCLAAILNDAIYVQETMNNPQKVLIASWDPMPIIYGSQLLIRAGAQTRMLSARQQQMLAEKFQTSEIQGN
jgi:hypothetical protein